jgi:hypothetical protein
MRSLAVADQVMISALASRRLRQAGHCFLHADVLLRYDPVLPQGSFDRNRKFCAIFVEAERRDTRRQRSYLQVPLGLLQYSFD